MAKLDADKKRAIYMVALGIITSSFIMFNSPDFRTAGGLYLVLGIITIGGYRIWDKV